MKITRGYKTELDPTVKQYSLLCQCAGAARFAYNYGLARKQEVYKESKKSISAIDLQKELTLRKHTDLSWLRPLSKWIVQNALRDLDTAYTNFFRRVSEKKAGKKHLKLGFPQFKSKSQGRGSFRLDKPIYVFEDRIQLPKLGTIQLKEHSYIPTRDVKILSATVSERAGKWFVSVLVEESVPAVLPATGQPIGVDLGISSLAVCSDGRPALANPKALHTNLKKLKRAQRHLSRCQKGSKNRQKARQQVARLHGRIADIREDALHQATSSLTHAPLTPSERSSLKTHLASVLPRPKTKAEQMRTKKQVKKLIHRTSEINAPLRPQVIVLEDLYVEGMKHNRKLARAISDVGMGEFRRQIDYKTLWNGERLLLADRFFPSSKTCHSCGWKWEDMELSDRIFPCQNPTCAFYNIPQDRDRNASENLATLAERYLSSLR
ncbi:MAG: RNA-guided endonuclease InsQ/TnpB family protein [Ktedonobacteraceae bacterium]|jgi:putative transposase